MISWFYNRERARVEKERLQFLSKAGIDTKIEDEGKYIKYVKRRMYKSMFYTAVLLFFAIWIVRMWLT